MKNQPADKMYYSQSLATHITCLSQLAMHLFDHKLDGDSQETLPSHESRMKSFVGEVMLFEAFILPSITPAYYKNTTNSKMVLQRWRASNEHNLDRVFDAAQQIISCLMVECHNANLLFSTSADEGVEE